MTIIGCNSVSTYLDSTVAELSGTSFQLKCAQGQGFMQQSNVDQLATGGENLLSTSKQTSWTRQKL